MDPHLTSIAALAWCRELGLDDDALATPGLVTRVDDSAPVVQVLHIGESTAIVGPSRAVAALTEVEAAHRDEAAVRAATAGHAGRTEVLSLCADWIDASRVDDPLISHRAADFAELLRRCPPDDATEVELTASEQPRAFVLLDDEHRPLSGAGYGEVHSLLADLRVLTVPDHRRRGLAATVTTLATHDALDAGLIPMWRARRDNLAARGLAAVSGYLEWGTRITVRLPVRM
ncbi:GNAT family N-acetyltransferase [Rhodococcus chondri]|uniref:GNAT family N-acetyltransferase n=1 Tax=Rhodococcus chondri TaxID=3065941 RepID=A0ABU7JYA6_9NOCA|nr:GNAT family N-acetyltransferase [Rhodococcus sp. CC-R104]MEE2035008.1 GNAT family N-acetyltransferase [Rhodococcus sp. CC-R104]